MIMPAGTACASLWPYVHCLLPLSFVSLSGSTRCVKMTLYMAGAVGMAIHGA